MAEHNGDKFIRRVTVGVLIALILNIPVSIYWAGVINTKVDNNTEAIKTLSSNIQILDSKIDDLSIRIAKLEP